MRGKRSGSERGPERRKMCGTRRDGCGECSLACVVSLVSACLSGMCEPQELVWNSLITSVYTVLFSLGQNFVGDLWATGERPFNALTKIENRHAYITFRKVTMNI